VIEENKQILKDKYAEAKELGESINAIRANINRQKGEVQRRRVKRGAAGLVGGEEEEDMEPDDEERELLRRIDVEKVEYKEKFTRLKSQKTEILPLQHMLEKSRRQLQVRRSLPLDFLDLSAPLPPPLPYPPPLPSPPTPVLNPPDSRLSPSFSVPCTPPHTLRTIRLPAPIASTSISRFHLHSFSLEVNW
jgi:kinesin family protein 6/9